MHIQDDGGTQALRVILVEDSEDDARLLLRTLRLGGFDLTYERVETAEALRELLTKQEWDLIISDHGLPQFSAPDALKLVRAIAHDLPFIIVSGSIGEELAVAAMKSGANDYLIKGQLARLVPAVKRELMDAGQRAERRRVEEALRDTEAQLRQAQKMESLGHLAGGVAHDFNNLLTAILGFSEFLLESSPPDTPERADLEEIRKAGERAATLTRQLLAFSRQQVMEPRVLNLNETIAGVERLLKRVIGEEIHLVTATDPHLERVKIDPGQLEQVLMNLAINARDAMPGGGTLEIRTSNIEATAQRPLSTPDLAPGRYVAIAVSDNGTGMPTHVKDRIFEPFFTTKEPGKGTGLGLSTVYGIVTQSGGHIVLETEVGRGTQFKIYLPAVPEEITVARPASRADVKSSGTETVLVADDEPGIRELVRRTLEGQGYRVLSVPDGHEALTLAKTHDGPLHLLITDVVMPRMGGVELAAHLSTKYPALRVLYVSGYSDQRIADLTSGDVQILTKPFTPRALVNKVQTILAGRDVASR